MIKAMSLTLTAFYFGLIVSPHYYLSLFCDSKCAGGQLIMYWCKVAVCGLWCVVEVLCGLSVSTVGVIAVSDHGCLVWLLGVVVKVYPGRFTFFFGHFILLKRPSDAPTCQLNFQPYRTTHTKGGWG